MVHDNPQEFQQGDWVRNKANPVQKGTIQEKREDGSYNVQIGIAKFKIIKLEKLEKFNQQETIDDLLEKDYYGHAHDLGKIIAYEELKEYSHLELYNFLDARRILIFCSGDQRNTFDKKIKEYFFNSEESILDIDGNKLSLTNFLEKIKNLQLPVSFAIIVTDKVIEKTSKSESALLEKIVSAFKNNIQQYDKIFDLVSVSLPAVLEDFLVETACKQLSRYVCKDFEEAKSSITKPEIINLTNKITEGFLRDNQQKQLFNKSEDEEGVYKIQLDQELQTKFKEYCDQHKFLVNTKLHQKEIKGYFDSQKVSHEIRQNPRDYELLNISHPFIQWIQKEYENDEKPWQYFHRLSAIELKVNEISDIPSIVTGYYLYAVSKHNEEDKEIQYSLKKIDNEDEGGELKESPEQVKKIIQTTAFQKNQSPIQDVNPDHKNRIQQYRQDMISNDILSLGLIYITD